MGSRRFWLRSKYDEAMVYVDQAAYTHCDGMPSLEANLLATVIKSGPKYEVRIYVPSPKLLHGFESLEAAQSAVDKHFSTITYVQNRPIR